MNKNRWPFLFVVALACLVAILVYSGPSVGAQDEPIAVPIAPPMEGSPVAPPLSDPLPPALDDSAALAALAIIEDELAIAVTAAVHEFAADSASSEVLPGQDITPQTQLRLNSFAIDGNRFLVNLSGPSEALDVVSWGEITHQIDMAITDTAAKAGIGWPSLVKYEIRLNGLLPGSLSEVPPADGSELTGIDVTNSIQGKKIVLSPGHGRYEESGWPFQRGSFFGAIEDVVNLDMMIAVNQALSATSADRRPTRQLDKNAGNHGASGRPWWEMGAREYLRGQGLPESVWNQTGLIPFWQDLMARPNYANYIGADVMVSLHNNGGGGTGTETWYDTSNAHSSESLRLANLVHNKVMERIRSQWNANWNDRHVKGAAGNYGENYYVNRPAILIEVGFMDNAADNAAIRDPQFQSIIAGAIRDALVEYYGGDTTSCGDGRFKVEYFRGREPGVGSPVYTACVNYPLDNNWGDGGPGNGVPNDEFSARWTGRFNFSGGNTRFTIVGDDGVRLWVDDQGVLTDGWKPQAPTTYVRDRNLSAGWHNVKFEFFEAGGGATARLRWEVAGIDCGDNRFKVEYFRGREPGVGSPVYTACVNYPLDNNWGDGGPGNGVPNDEFSARWTGRFNFSGGNTRFTIVGDDGVRLWVDDQGVLTDGWKPQAPTTYVRDRNLSAGWHNVKFEFFEAGGGATARLRWEAVGTDYTPPSGYTFCAWEDQRCNFSDRRDVAYGANGQFHYRSGITGGIDCNNATFGDPISSVFKACFTRPAGSSGNLALNRTAAATSQESSTYSPSKGNDGNNGTRWSSAISPSLGNQFWRVDLGSQQNFNKVRINWEAAYAAQYKVVWSDDGENWYCFCDEVQTTSGPGWKEYTFPTRYRRYVGIHMLSRAPTMNNYSFWEMEVYRDGSRADDLAVPDQLEILKE